MKSHLIFAVAALSALVHAESKPKPQWSTGRVTDIQDGPSTYVETGASRPNYDGGVAKHSTVSEVRSMRVLLAGDVFNFTVDGVSRSIELGFARKNCRFIVGDDVRYRDEKDKMHIVDADGKDCEGQIVRQERISAPATPHP